MILPENLTNGQVVEARFSRRDTEDGCSPDWSDWELVTLFVKRRAKTYRQGFQHFSRDSKKGDIIELGINEKAWASYTGSDYSSEHDTWLAEEYRMQIR